MVINNLTNKIKWQEFLEYKTSKEFANKKEMKVLTDFIESEKYLPICTQIVGGTYNFSIPKKHIISKGSTNKKRLVYTFNSDEMIILKYISFLLYEYDYLFSKNLYSFRKNSGVKNAIKNLSKIRNLNKMYGYKVDIQNYFNSIDIDILTKNLKNDLTEVALYDLFEKILKNEYVEYNGNIIKEKKGVMAGTPISAFLANYYIKEIDESFFNEKLVYLRYADDIILFCNNKEELKKAVKKLKSLFDTYNLKINKTKEYFFNPEDKWEFLGFSFQDKIIDLSDNSIRKIKGKIRRTARGLRRWMLRKNADKKGTLKAMNRKYNSKFFGKENKEELSWKYWFFPTINTSKSLKIVDDYMQNLQRYIITGKHNKMNYKHVPYSYLKECGYKSLVSEYYKYIKIKNSHTT